MPQYRYSAKGMDGLTVKGLLEADNINRLRQQLKEKNLFCLEAEEMPAIARSGIKVNLKDVAMFSRQFYTLLNSGVTVIKALDILYQQTESKRLKGVILKIYEAVQKGDMLSEAVKKQPKAFPDLMVSMMETGEASGTLDKAMSRMSSYMDREVKLKNKITSAMIYPIMIGVVTVAVIAILVMFVLPGFVTIFSDSGVKLPGMTMALLGISHFATKYWYLVIMMLVALVVLIRAYISSDQGRLNWDRAKLKLPVVKKAVIKIYASRFTETMSTLLSGGLPLLHAMEITSRVIGNQLIAEKIIEAREDVRKGLPLSTAIREINVLPPIVHSMINVGEESGALDTLLERTARYYDDEVETAIARLVSMIEPIMIIFMALIVGAIVVSIALPMFDMFNTIQT